MKVKKLIPVILAMVLALTLTACGSSGTRRRAVINEYSCKSRLWAAFVVLSIDFDRPMRYNGICNNGFLCLKYK